jgi:hypothetical protein
MAKLYSLYGVGQAIFNVLPPPIFFENPPTSFQDNYSIGQIVYTGSVGAYAFYFYSGAGVWIEIISATGDVLSVTGTPNQITATNTSGAVVLTVPSTFVAPGTIAATTTVTAPSGFIATTAGAGITLNSGATSGTTTATLNGRSGQITITTPTINADATFTMTIANTSITSSTTQILYGLTGGTTGSAITIQSVTNSANQSVVVVQNASAVTNSTGSLVLTFLVLN